MVAGKTIVCEMPFLPCLEHFVVWQQAEKVIFDVYEHYVKQTYRNRCYILGANGPLSLTVPIQHTAPKMPFNEVLIDYKRDWQRPMWKSIISAYGNAPFFDYFAEDFEEVLMQPIERLMDLNDQVLTLCLNFLQFPAKFEKSKKYFESKDFDFIDLRSIINPKKSFKGRKLYQPIAYQQNFGSDFVPNLSVLDLIFCEGPGASEVIRKSAC